MRATTLLSVFTFIGATVQAAPFNTILPNDKTKDTLQAINSSVHIGRAELSSPFESGAAAKDDYFVLEKRARLPTMVVEHGDAQPGDIKIALINATPYRWKRVDIHNYQLEGWGNPGDKEWRSRWPEMIQPGESHQYQVFTRKGSSFRYRAKEDCAGEVTYELQGTEKPMSFEIQFKMLGFNTYEVHAEFREELNTKTANKGERILIGNQKSAGMTVEASAAWGGCSFHIAGREGDFTSTKDWNRPDHGGWMQDLLSVIGDYPLKEIVMPRSHHAALDTTKNGHEPTKLSPFAGQSVTQTLPIHQQLSAEGVRILDERVHYSKEKGFLHAHMTPVRVPLYELRGSFGRRLDEVIEAINDFQDANPGELIIWDFHYDTYNFDDKNKAFSLGLRKKLYSLLKTKLKHLARLPELDDYTELTLNDLIGNGKSAVICRFDRWEGVPSAKEGFVTTDNFPVNDRWSAKYDVVGVFEDQFNHLRGAARHGTAHGTQFLRTLPMPHVAYIPEGMTLVLMAREFMTWFRFQFWNVLTHEKYPNWLTMDGFEGGEVKGFFIAMNKCFVAQQCGDWTGTPR